MGCCQTVYYSSEYIKSYQCKLLGLSDKVLPDLTMNDDHTLNMFGDLNEFINLDVNIEPKQTITHHSTYSAYSHHMLEFDACLEMIKENNLIEIKMVTNVQHTLQCNCLHLVVEYRK